MVQWEEQVLKPQECRFKSFEPLSLLLCRNSTNTTRTIVPSYWKRAPSIGLINSGDYSKISTKYPQFFTLFYPCTQSLKLLWNAMFLNVCYGTLHNMCGDWVNLLIAPFFFFYQVLLHKHFKNNLPPTRQPFLYGLRPRPNYIST